MLNLTFFAHKEYFPFEENLGEYFCILEKHTVFYYITELCLWKLNNGDLFAHSWK